MSFLPQYLRAVSGYYEDFSHETSPPAAQYAALLSRVLNTLKVTAA
jgi:hypothetical protein